MTSETKSGKIRLNHLTTYFLKSHDRPRLFSLNLQYSHLETRDFGFATWYTTEDTLVVGSVYGDGKYWHDFFIQKAKSLNCNSILFASFRIDRQRAFERRFGAECVGHIYEVKVR